MKQKWGISTLGVLLIVLIGFFYPHLAQSQRKIISFNAG